MIDPCSVLQIVMWGLIAAALASFLWAGLWYFRQDPGWNTRKVLYKISIYLCMALHAAAVLFFPRFLFWSMLGGSVLLAVSLALFWGAVSAHRGARPKFAFDEPQVLHLASTGPYRFIRHPFYSSFLLASAAGAMIAGRPELLLTVPWLAFFYVRAAKDEEAFLLSSDVAEPYRRYCEHTGRFVPRLKSWPRI